MPKPTPQELYTQGKITLADRDARLAAMAKPKAKQPKQPKPKQAASVRSEKAERPKAQKNRAPPKPPTTKNTAFSLDASDLNKASKYAACLICPESYQSRVPTANKRKSFTLLSKCEESIYANFSGSWASLNGGADAGRFSVVINPTMGFPNSPINYKLAIVDGRQSQWPTDFASPSSYLSKSGNLDPRVDPYLQTMTQQQAFFFECANAVNSGADAPLTGGITPNGANYGFNPPISISSAPFVTLISLPPGNYYVAADSTWTAANATTLHTASLTLRPPTNGQIDTITNDTSSNVTDGLNASATALITVTQSPCFLAWTNSGANDTILPGEATLAITPAFWVLTTDDSTFAMLPYINGGPAENIRTVACSAFFQFEASFLVGGTQTGAYLVPGIKPNQVFQTITDGPIGQLQNYEQLAKTNDYLQDPSRKGLYGYWTPADQTGIDMTPPSEHVVLDIGALMISGQVTTQTTGNLPNGAFKIGTLQVFTLYEITTEQTIWAAKNVSGYTMDVERAWNWLDQQPHWKHNPDHAAWILNMLKKFGMGVARLTWNNKSAIATALANVALSTV